jgi:hypothetical protein
LNEPFFVDTAALREHLDVIREKQRNARILADQLNQVRSRIQPELYAFCSSLLRYTEELLRYFDEQENLILEMSARYDAVSYAVGDKLETAGEMVDYLS